MTLKCIIKGVVVNPRLRALATALLGPRNGYPTDRTEPREVTALIGRLAPVSTDKKLIRLGPTGDGG